MVKSDNHKGTLIGGTVISGGPDCGRVYSGLEFARHFPSQRHFHITILRNRQVIVGFTEEEIEIQSSSLC